MKIPSIVFTSIGCMVFSWALPADPIRPTPKDEAVYTDPALNRSYIYNKQYLEDRAYVNGTSYWATGGLRGTLESGSPEFTERIIKEQKVENT